MGDDGSKQSLTSPMPKFRFEADLGTELQGITFQEASGLDVETHGIEYRANNRPPIPNKLPRVTTTCIVVMRRGVFVNDSNFWNWVEQFKSNTIATQTIRIKLLDEKGSVVMQWTLNDALPMKITGTDLKSDGNEVTVDTIEIAYGQMTIIDG